MLKQPVNQDNKAVEQEEACLWGCNGFFLETECCSLLWNRIILELGWSYLLDWRENILMPKGTSHELVSCSQYHWGTTLKCCLQPLTSFKLRGRSVWASGTCSQGLHISVTTSWENGCILQFCELEMPSGMLLIAGKYWSFWLQLCWIFSTSVESSSFQF